MPLIAARSVAPGAEPSCETAARPVPAKVVMRGPEGASARSDGRTTAKSRTPAETATISTPTAHNQSGLSRGRLGPGTVDWARGAGAAGANRGESAATQ